MYAERIAGAGSSRTTGNSRRLAGVKWRPVVALGWVAWCGVLSVYLVCLGGPLPLLRRSRCLRERSHKSCGLDAYGFRHGQLYALATRLLSCARAARALASSLCLRGRQQKWPALAFARRFSRVSAAPRLREENIHTQMRLCILDMCMRTLRLGLRLGFVCFFLFVFVFLS